MSTPTHTLQHRPPLHMRGAPGRVGRVTLARRAVQALNMAPPSPAEPKAPAPSSAAKSEEEMVLPGFPDADSFVKVSPRGLGQGAGSTGAAAAGRG